MNDESYYSNGMGVQSVATLVLQAQGRLHYDAHIFANVGDDSEDERTLAYLRDYARPFAEKHGIRLVEVFRLFKGERRTLYEHLIADNNDIPIPVRMAGNRAPGGRNCTREWKVAAVNRWLREQKVSRARIGVGFTVDEMYRATSSEWKVVYVKPRLETKREYPLIELGLSRSQCAAIILEAGLPLPPKSSCWFCPFLSRSQHVEDRRNNPALFERRVKLEKALNAKRARLGRDAVAIHPSGKPLEQAVGEQASLFELMEDDLECGSGYCGL